MRLQKLYGISAQGFGIFLSLAQFACVFDSGNGAPPLNQWEIKPGLYRGNYAVAAKNPGLESELILDSAGSFRFTMIQGGSPYYVAKGQWSADRVAMIWKSFVAVTSHSGIDFGSWQSFAPDTSQFRLASDTSFERQEIVFDSVEGEKIRWVPYRKQHPLPAPATGKFEYVEKYRDSMDTTRLINGITFMEFQAGGKYRDGSLVNGDTVVEFQSGSWKQTGTFVITMQNRFRNYNDSLHAFGPWQDEPADYEYVFRIQAVTPDSFQSWQTLEVTHQGVAYWARFHRVPNP